MSKKKQEEKPTMQEVLKNLPKIKAEPKKPVEQLPAYVTSKRG